MLLEHNHQDSKYRILGSHQPELVEDFSYRIADIKRYIGDMGSYQMSPLTLLRGRFQVRFPLLSNRELHLGN